MSGNRMRSWWLLALVASTGWLPAVTAQEPSAVQDRGSIVYERLGELWVVSPDGGQPRLLLSRRDPTNIGAGTSCSAPAWSPDASRVAFRAGRELAVVNADGSGFKQLTVDAPAVSQYDYQHGIQGYGAPTWSPDGKVVAIRGGRHPELVAIHPETGGRQVLFRSIERSLEDPTGTLDDDQITPAAREAARQARGSLAVGQELEDRVRQTLWGNGRVSWWPGARPVTALYDYRSWYVGTAGLSVDWHSVVSNGLVSIDAGGGFAWVTQRRETLFRGNTVTGDQRYIDFIPAWSSRGALLFTRKDRDFKDPAHPFEDRGYALFELTPGGQPRQLTDWGLPFSGYTWSPDGAEVLYSRRPAIDQFEQLWVQSLAGGAPRQLGGGGELWPSWGAATSDLALRVVTGEAKMRVWQGTGVPNAVKGEHALVTAPDPLPTRYGRTFVSFKVHALEGKARKADLVVTLTPTSPGCTLRSSLDGADYPSLKVRTGADGTTPTVYLVTDDPHRRSLDEVAVLAQAPGAADETRALRVVDNLDLILQSYMQTIPRSQAYDPVKHLQFKPVGSSGPGRYALLFVPQQLAKGNINNKPGSIVCSNYQATVLAFLNQLRHGATTAHLLNGLHYGPIQTKNGGHFATAIYPERGAMTDDEARILDPWPAQTPLVFTWPQWRGIFFSAAPDTVTFSSIDPGYVPPYPLFPQGSTSYPVSGSGGQLAPVTFKLSVVLRCPVELLFTTPDGARVGYVDGDHVNDAGHRFQRMDLPEADGTTAKVVDLPVDEGELSLVGLADGTFTLDLLFARPDGSFTRVTYADQPITRGEVVRFTVDPARPGVAGARADGRPVEISQPVEVVGEDPLAGVDLGPLPPDASAAAPPARRGGGGCSLAPGGQGGGAPASLIALALIAACLGATRRGSPRATAR